MEHTPGPWKYERHATLSGGTIVAPSQSADELSEIIAHALSSPNDADMALIAAAPLLLRDLRMAVELADAVIKDLGSEDWRIPFVRDSWKATIAKATGANS